MGYRGIAAVAIGLALAGLGCSDVNFDQSAGSSGAGDGVNGNLHGTGSPAPAPGSGNGGDDAAGQIGQNGGTTGGPVVTGGPGGTTNPVVVPVGFPPPPPGVTDAPPVAPPGSTFPPGTTAVPAGVGIPLVVRGEPPCQRLTWCEYQLFLDKAYPLIVDFDWRTNDNLGAVIAVPDGHIRALPNVHYVPGSGHVRFLPGETVRKIYVLNINPDPTIRITIPFIFSNCMYGAVALNCTAIFR